MACVTPCASSQSCSTNSPRTPVVLNSRTFLVHGAGTRSHWCSLWTSSARGAVRVRLGPPSSTTATVVHQGASKTDESGWRAARANSPEYGRVGSNAGSQARSKTQALEDNADEVEQHRPRSPPGGRQRKTPESAMMVSERWKRLRRIPGRRWRHDLSSCPGYARSLHAEALQQLLGNNR